MSQLKPGELVGMKGSTLPYLVAFLNQKAKTVEFRLANYYLTVPEGFAVLQCTSEGEEGAPFVVAQNAIIKYDEYNQNKVDDNPYTPSHKDFMIDGIVPPMLPQTTHTALIRLNGDKKGGGFVINHLMAVNSIEAAIMALKMIDIESVCFNYQSDMIVWEMQTKSETIFTIEEVLNWL